MSHSEADIIKLLTDYCSDESWMNRQLGAQLAASQNFPQLERLLCRLLKDRIDWVRYHALQALIRLNIPPSRLVPLAEALSTDSFFRVRQAAVSYLEDTAREYLARKHGSAAITEEEGVSEQPPTDPSQK